MSITKWKLYDDIEKLAIDLWFDKNPIDEISWRILDRIGIILQNEEEYWVWEKQEKDSDNSNSNYRIKQVPNTFVIDNVFLYHLLFAVEKMLVDEKIYRIFRTLLEPKDKEIFNELITYYIGVAWKVDLDYVYNLLYKSSSELLIQLHFEIKAWKTLSDAVNTLIEWRQIRVEFLQSKEVKGLIEGFRKIINDATQGNLK